MRPPMVPSSPEGTPVDVLLDEVVQGLQRASRLAEASDAHEVLNEVEAIIESAIDRLVEVRDQIVRYGLFRQIDEATSAALEDFSERVLIDEFQEPHKWIGGGL